MWEMMKIWTCDRFVWSSIRSATETVKGSYSYRHSHWYHISSNCTNQLQKNFFFLKCLHLWCNNNNILSTNEKPESESLIHNITFYSFQFLSTNVPFRILFWRCTLHFCVRCKRLSPVSKFIFLPIISFFPRTYTPGAAGSLKWICRSQLVTSCEKKICNRQPDGYHPSQHADSLVFSNVTLSAMSIIASSAVSHIQLFFLF